eukprot:g56475.t1
MRERGAPPAIDANGSDNSPKACECCQSSPSSTNVRKSAARVQEVKDQNDVKLHLPSRPVRLPPAKSSATTNPCPNPCPNAGRPTGN